MLPTLRLLLLTMLSFTSSYGIGQVPLIDFPDLTSITFYEQTGGITPYTFNVNSIELTTRVPGQLNTTNRDFEGTPDREFYDVYYSDADGTFNINGGYVSIECRYDLSFGSALNINEVEFHFGSGYSTFARYMTSYLTNGGTYIPGSEELASDCDMVTFAAMGYTENTSIKLRVTIGILDAPSTIIQEACSGSGFEVNAGSMIFNEANPFGTELLTGSDGCDSLVYVDLTFHEVSNQEISYLGCNGDGYSIVVGNTLYNESNPSGIEMLLSQGNCDSTIVVDLVFGPIYFNEIIYNGCEGDVYSVNVNGTVYNEANPVGTETMLTSNGCDSVYSIQLVFAPTSFYEIDYIGCAGDNYSVEVNGTIYDEQNPSGIEILTGQSGCDSIVTINLIFQNIIAAMHCYTGCAGDGYSVVINGNMYNQVNPNGVEIIPGSMGCDTFVTIALLFQPLQSGSILYVGCEGDGFEVLVNGTLYNASNPQGTEIMMAQNGCDSIITIALDFLSATQHIIDYEGCVGDTYSILINGILYNENNPTGMETLTGSNGCDSIVTINLAFGNQIATSETYSGCEGDGYSILVNGNLYNEQHPAGSETIPGDSGCDTLVDIDLTFAPASLSTITYAGCAGDGYVLDINGTTYSELHPNGEETMTNVHGCDSIIVVALSFDNVGSSDISYTGCLGDGYAVIVNGSTFNELNPSGVEMVQTPNGCDSIIEVALIYEDCHVGSLDCAIYIPNVISPNDDGINDEFSFGYSVSCEVARFSVALFDRWGQALYASSDHLFKWKGDFRDKPLLPGVYVFVAEIYFADTSTPLIRRGDVTIIR